jgi:ribosomal-protein-alanine N-acetyltransferase
VRGPVTPALQTRRLLLRPLELSDAEVIQMLFPQWEVVRYLADRVPWPYPPDGAERFIREIALPAVERGEQWHWTLRLKTEPESLIGAINLRKGQNENRGFWIAPPWQGMGLMSEAVEVVTDYWFDALGFPVLRAPKAVANEASRRISLKQGMHLVAVEDRNYVGGRFPSEIWEISSEEWRVRRRV